MSPRLMVAPAPSTRLSSVDVVRGLAVVVMTLDHARDFFSDGRGDPSDLLRTTAPLFLLRWIAGFSAPTFCFLAGAGAYLAAERERNQAARFLWTRGLWLVLLELTLVHLAFFGPSWRTVPLINLWALGWSMVAMAALVSLPPWLVGVLGAGCVLVGSFESGVRGGALWTFAVEPGVVSTGPLRWFVAYPILPWLGVMALGFAFGPILRLAGARRARVAALVGGALVGAFVLGRALGWGDPEPYSPQWTTLGSLLAFLKCEKFPPSAVYVCLTVGGACLAVAAAERLPTRVAARLRVLGAVPLFYYLAHLILLHAAVTVLFWPRFGAAMLGFRIRHLPPGYGVAVPWVLVVAVALLVGLYPLCVRYAAIKRTRRGWLRYL